MQVVLLPGTFAVCRLGPEEPIPAALLSAAPVAITRTADELSVVCPEEMAPAHGRCERGWRCLKVRGPLPLSSTGVLASLARPLAEASVPLFAVSTFDTDYLLVPETQLERAMAALRAAGHEVSS